jgi:signal peptidase I
MRLTPLVVGRHPRATLIRSVTLIVAAFVVFGWLLVPMRLSGISMEPTYHDGAMNFANRAAYWFRHPARGDVVAIRMAGPSVMYVKRIVGMPGEQLEIVDGTVLINGAPLVEPTVVRRLRWNRAAVTIGADEFFVIGDNRSMLMKDHELGQVTRARIVGKLLF